MLIYTTNALKGFNIQPRKVTKTKTVFLTNDTLLKMLYLTIKKWTGKRREWGVIYSQLEVFFTERLPNWGLIHRLFYDILIANIRAFSPRRSILFLPLFRLYTNCEQVQ